MKSTVSDTLRIYWNHAKRYPWSALLTLITIVAAVLFDSLRPLLYKQFFDILGLNLPDMSDQLLHIIFLVFGINIVVWVMWRISGLAAIYSSARVMSDLLNSCFQYIHGHSYDFFSNNFVGSLSRKISRYARSYEDVTDRVLWDLGPTVITMVVIIIVLYTRQPLLAAIILGWTILYVAVNYWFVTYKMQFDLKRVEVDTKTNGYLADTITNHLNIKLFSAQKREFLAFTKLTASLKNWRAFTWNLDVVSQAVQGMLMIVLELGVMYYAVLYWKQGVLTIGDFALIQAYLLRMFQSLWNVGKYLHRIFESLADAQEMTDILVLEHSVKDAIGSPAIAISKGEISFQGVGFGYHIERPVFRNLDIVIGSGERIAFVGESGGGKTTIVKLILRFFDIQSGHITIDGQNIAHVTQDSLRQSIAVVPQEPILFHRTLYENIRYSKPNATREQVMEASRLAHCHEFIMKFPDQYETLVGERGVKLSGGERQRVAIARAMLKDAPILILDEATSSLDSVSERYIQDALQVLMKNRTTIVIAHRLSTIMQMDRIVVLEKGKIAEQGTHDELVTAAKGRYQKLWQIQVGGFAKTSNTRASV